jgi:hypothetical protein
MRAALCCREVALEEFEDFSNVQDSVFVRIANIPLQESIRDLRWGWWVSVVGAWAALLRCLLHQPQPPFALVCFPLPFPHPPRRSLLPTLRPPAPRPPLAPTRPAGTST